MLDLEKKFENELIKRAEKVRASKPPVVLPPRKSYEPPSQPRIGKTEVFCIIFIICVVTYNV